MAIFQGLLFLIFGVGILVIDLRSLKTGALPFGSNFARGRLMVERDSNSLGYWCAFLFYLAFGLWLTFMAMGILVGDRPPLPLQ